MKLEQLVGKKVMRIAPNGNDRSFMSTESVVEVLEIVNSVPLVKITYDGIFDNKKTERIKDLTSYNDDCWIDATEVFARIKALRKTLN